ncbi:MAG: hypothetical protein EPN97_02220 [Alphaproteobacteria bacterium]|nr:MAG: hypothetical protein EPN97_02220 [Alphaproteobacteria bacterium]
MRKDKEIRIPDLNPDFRQMSEKDLRHGISEINRTIKALRQDEYRRDGEIDDLVTLRAKFKTVWRARPGRPVHDLAARFKRQQKRQGNDGFYFPFMP